MVSVSAVAAIRAAVQGVRSVCVRGGVTGHQPWYTPGRDMCNTYMDVATALYQRCPPKMGSVMFMGYIHTNTHAYTHTHTYTPGRDR